MKKDLIQTIKITLLAVVLTVGVSYVFAWTETTDTPPANNTPTPINEGTTNQIKNAGLGLDALSVFGTTYIQDILGVGDSTPDNGLLLDVEGNIGAMEFCDENGLNCFDIADIAKINNCADTDIVCN